MVAVEQTSGKVYLPSLAPTRSAIAAQRESDVGSLGKFGRGEWRDGMAGMQPVEVREVTMLAFALGKFLVPLKQLTLAAHLVGWQFGKHLAQLPGIFLVFVEYR